MSYREDLIMAAVRAFARRGPEGTTVNDIAAEAAVSQPRISQIFGSKEQAWQAAFTWASTVVVQELTDRLEHHQQPETAWDAVKDQRPDELMVLLHCLSAARHFPDKRENMRDALGAMAGVAEQRGLPADAFVREGLLTSVEVSLGVSSLNEVVTLSS
ncbi:TetR/AcrR family transcriptional regulator [Enemella sp. A6]|uniref:TetR/AcrR family transcriptional regulator n=1 Tax=Enemella sp. A6 TaxID=3440152 RepID=UPI003EBE8164